MFKKSLIALGATLMALSACTDTDISFDDPTISSTEPGKDNYKFEVKERTSDTLIIKVIEYKSIEELRAVYEKIEKIKASDGRYYLMAYTQMRNMNGVATCTIHIVDPSSDYQPEYIGHELMHCLHGQWHPTQP